MKRILKSELDKFYTKEEVAKNLISKIDFSKYDLVVDPSCGDGAFYLNINHENKIGIDILPNIDGVITSDFLEWNYSKYNINKEKCLVITNPPFGKQGSLALKFIKYSSNFADTIAMILPLSFAKDSMKDKIPEYYHLTYEEILKDDSYLLDGNDYSVKCVFQIWERKDYKRNKTTKINPKGFTYTNKENANISIRRVGVYAGKGFKDCNKSEQSHYFIRVDDIRKIDIIIEKLDNHKWNDLTVGPRSISKNELNEVLNSII